jgi:hypothetical protein
MSDIDFPLPEWHDDIWLSGPFVSRRSSTNLILTSKRAPTLLALYDLPETDT